MPSILDSIAAFRKNASKILVEKYAALLRGAATEGAYAARGDGKDEPDFGIGTRRSEC
jgi:hypothetical protein